MVSLFTHRLTSNLPSEQKNLLVLGAAALQPEQRRELLRHAGQLVASVHCGDISRHDQQRRRGQWRNEHESGGGSGNQHQSWGVHHGQRCASPRHPDGTSFPGYCKCPPVIGVTFIPLPACVCVFVFECVTSTSSLFTPRY